MNLFGLFRKSPLPPPVPNVRYFLADLQTIAPAVGLGDYAFPNEVGGPRGWVQFIIESDRRLTIHRLWTLDPGKGHGSTMLRAVCSLADKHAVELSLKPLPFGKKPYYLRRQSLAEWYARHGFAWTQKKMVRVPASAI